jgi:hypothetical protein
MGWWSLEELNVRFPPQSGRYVRGPDTEFERSRD